MKRPMLIMLVSVALFFGAVFGWKAFVGIQIQTAMQAMAMPPVTVSTMLVSDETWAPAIAVVGSLRAVQGVDVSAQVEGQIIELHFDSGDSVAAGDLLVQQYTADELAELEGRVADRQLAELNYKRLKNLSRKQLVSEFDLDASRTELQRSKAIEKNLLLNIEKKSIRAPFAGQLGIRSIDLGQYIEPGDPLVRLEAIAQLLVDFTVSQRQIGQLSVGQTVFAYVDAWQGQRFAGVIEAVAPKVESNTRNVRVRAVLANVDTRLVPGMFARVEIQLPTQGTVVTVPQSAVTYSPYGDSVYVVANQPEQAAGDQPVYAVSNTFVVLGATRGDQVAIESGLTAGMTVVTAGQQKLRNGSQVVIDNSVPVSNNPTPRPDNN
jgi:membrane fusion protein (multidrug efflux system)